ncbi:heme exporter protein CcmD [Asticcacaulis sp. DW145]|jgi:heme exporter protein D|uniref:Heme exporter protein D n=1 Tax=Asticcacaulis currens TaxID=2984210 RepID=A0ABT5IAM4_9CAUL|nr:heme exporter protein CcmD [Asticcacaulis currens]MDC7693234.1 heme exporter protein CcmD [Asticcacaulis currens]BEV09826.1 heme exporter protein CcmD [Asticcacaulis sp. DW145]
MDLNMGKYAFFVWGSYGVTALALLSLTVLSVRAHRERARKLRALQETLAAEKAQKVDA